MDLPADERVPYVQAVADPADPNEGPLRNTRATHEVGSRSVALGSPEGEQDAGQELIAIIRAGGNSKIRGAVQEQPDSPHRDRGDEEDEAENDVRLGSRGRGTPAWRSGRSSKKGGDENARVVSRTVHPCDLGITFQRSGGAVAPDSRWATGASPVSSQFR
jgi:hypothetical protein